MTHPKALQTVLRDYRLVFYLLGGTGWWGEEKQECNRGGGGAERERRGGLVRLEGEVVDQLHRVSPPLRLLFSHFSHNKVGNNKHPGNIQSDARKCHSTATGFHPTLISFRPSLKSIANISIINRSRLGYFKKEKKILYSFNHKTLIASGNSCALRERDMWGRRNAKAEWQQIPGVNVLVETHYCFSFFPLSTHVIVSCSWCHYTKVENEEVNDLTLDLDCPW